MIFFQKTTEKVTVETFQEIEKNRIETGKVSVFWLSTLSLLGLIGLSVCNSEAGRLSTTIQKEVIRLFGWLYSPAMNIYILACLILMLSPLGRIRLGATQESRPEFKTPTWLAMLFSAGMGIGLFFYGVSEPLSHYLITFNGQKPASDALALTMLHWGIHPWSCYAVIGLCFAYFHYRKKYPFTITGCLQKIPGLAPDGWSGRIIETATVVCPVVGVATSLGLGALQISKGLDQSFGVSSGTGSEIAVILVITLISTWSVVSGVEKGMKYLSVLNMLLSFFFLSIILLLVGPPGAIREIASDTLTYFHNLPHNALWAGGHDYLSDGGLVNWTTFYWSSWIAWAPFVGMFIARISKGRTIREFVAGVVLIPTLLSMIWFSVLGQSAIALLANQADEITRLLSTDVPATFFLYLSRLPGSMILYSLALVCLNLFFITSSDSAALVIATAASGGKNPSTKSKVYWSVSVSILAVIFINNGGLETMQVINIISAVPFTLISFGMLGSLFHGLLTEKLPKKQSTENRLPAGSVSDQADTVHQLISP